MTAGRVMYLAGSLIHDSFTESFIPSLSLFSRNLNYYKVGEFTMYRSTNPNHNFEVREHLLVGGVMVRHVVIELLLLRKTNP